MSTKQRLFRATAVAAAFFSIYANLVGLITETHLTTYIRDAIVMLMLLIGVYRANAAAAFLCSICSGLLLVLCILKGLSPEVLPKVRNYVLFPLVALAVSLASRGLEKGDALTSERWINWIFYSLVFTIASEAGLYLLFPEFQALASAALSQLSEEKGVFVGLGGGLINGGRVMTPLLSPVQGGFLLFLSLAFLKMKRTGRRRRALLFYASHLATASKVSLAAWIGLRLIESRAGEWILITIGLSIGVVAVLAWAPEDMVEINIESIKLHLRGAVAGLLSPLDAPWGLELSEVGALAANDASVVQPGFESFIGSFSAAFGVAGVLLVQVLAITLATRSRITALTFAMWMLSDNVSSPHLFVVPLLYLLLQPKPVVRRTSVSGVTGPQL